ncbi:hypothetical protein D9M72_433150 [compost metagenome]
MKIRNTFIIFLVSGFWHGANWTFLAWGFLNALYFLPLLLSNKNRTHTGNIERVGFIQGMKLIPQIGMTFALTCLAWIFFRARTITDAFGYIKRMFSNLQFKPQYFNIERYNFELVLMLVLFVGFEWFNRYKIEPISGKYSYPKICLAIMVLLLFGVYSEYKSFIYFQF